MQWTIFLTDLEAFEPTVVTHQSAAILNMLVVTCQVDDTSIEQEVFAHQNLIATTI